MTPPLVPAKRIRIYGIVQGVGFRPFVSRAASRLGLRGSVSNRGSYVEVHVQGPKKAEAEFLHVLEHEAPERSTILRIEVKETREPEASSFVIAESEHERGNIFVSPDIATCPACTKELYDPADPRYLHPFINCTACGPRLTILDAMPYDRERTSMKEFPMCGFCHGEYTDPATRRYDAQPVCCPSCGPEVFLLGRPERGAAAIRIVREALAEGRIAAVKGIGGFHLCCDAHNADAVALLRKRKRRPMKPFALMMRDLETVRRHCHISPEEEAVLTGHQKPILLLKRKETSDLPEILAPGCGSLGVMLPYAPIHMLLFRSDDPLDDRMTDTFVMTSGNVSGAPICRSDEDALSEIATFCDLILTHDRRIRLRADDSVMEFFRGAPYMIRRSRGYAPLPVSVSGDLHGAALGIGGELKNTFCLGQDDLFYLSSYIGDMADLRSVKALRESVERMSSLLEIRPDVVVCDPHPMYNSSRTAEELGLPVLKVQHHYAHILSCMAENDHDQEVIGVSFDGTGYGDDGTIWGGEFLLCDRNGSRRIGHIRPFIQAGGDASAREGWRIAAAMIRDRFGDRAPEIVRTLSLCSEQERKILDLMLDRKINCALSTSAGRLFDAVSAILGICRSSTFEGEGAMALQHAAERFGDAGRIRFPEESVPVWENEKFVLPTEHLAENAVRAALEDRPPEESAFLFHAGLAEMIVSGCGLARERTGCGVCALSGGVFQNTLLLDFCITGLEKKGFHVLRHRLVPPNDGGIALGQALYGMNWLKNNIKK